MLAQSRPRLMGHAVHTCIIMLEQPVGCIPARVPSRQVKSSADSDELCAYFQFSNHSCALNFRIFASFVETATMLAHPVPRRMCCAAKLCLDSQSGAYRHAFLLRVVASRRRLERLAGNLRLSCALNFKILLKLKRVVRLILKFFYDAHHSGLKSCRKSQSGAHHCFCASARSAAVKVV